ncbi:hypothetical protein MMC24_005310 [Lignoscripta atroalba]|nr:hypothetical protein [Lignoscripta atroalba]
MRYTTDTPERTHITKVFSQDEVQVHRTSAKSKVNLPAVKYVNATLPQPSKHNWSLEEEGVLCVLTRWLISVNSFTKHGIAMQDIRLILCAYFANDLVNQDSRSSLSNSAIAARIWKMKQEGEDNLAWREVYVETDFRDPKGLWSTTKLELKATAAAIGIVLVERGFEHKMEVLANAGRGFKSKKRKRSDGCTGVLGFRSDWSENEADTMVTSPIRRACLPTLTPSPGPRKAQTAKPTIKIHPSHINYETVTFSNHNKRTAKQFDGSLPTPMSSRRSFPKKKKPKDKDRIPLHKHTFKEQGLAFRSYDDDSNGVNTPTGFRAGAYREPAIWPKPPPDRRSKEFREAATIHLTPMEKPSGYISITQSPLAPIHRALRSTANPKVAIIDLHHLTEAQKPHCPSLYPAKSVINQLGILGFKKERNKSYPYKGTSEWIVWECIEREAVITTFSIQELSLYLEKYPGLAKTLRLEGIREAENATEYQEHINNTRLPMSRASGRAIGHFLGFTGLPESFLDVAALKFARSWGFIGRDNNQRQRSYLDGAHAGFLHFYGTKPVKSMPECGKDGKRGHSINEDAEDGFMAKRGEIQAVLGLCRRW